MSAYIVGTPEHIVTACSLIASKYALAENWGNKTTFPPLAKAILEAIEAFL